MIYSSGSVLGLLKNGGDIPAPSGGVVPINNSSDTPVVGGVPTFLEGITYQIQQPIPDWPTQGVLMEDRSACVDLNMVDNKITMAGTGTMFYGSGDVYLNSLVLDCPNGQFYDFEDPVGGQKTAIILKNQNLNCAKIGTFDNHAITVIDFFRVTNADQGLTFTGQNKIVQSISRAAIGTTVGSGFVAVDQTDMLTVFLEYDVHVITGPSGGVAYKGLSNSGNLVPTSVGTISGCEVVGGMSVLDGISGDDTGYRFVNTPQVDDSTVLGCGYLDPLVLPALTDVQLGVDTVLVGAYLESSEASQATMSPTGTLTTQNRVFSKAIVSANMVIDKQGAGTDTYRFAIQKKLFGEVTWEDVEESVKTVTTQGAETPNVFLRGPTRTAQGDEYRVVVRGVDTTDDIELRSNSFTIQKI